MTSVDRITERYTGDRYGAANPDWHLADSSWKAAQVLRLLGGEQFETICEVGCGAGEILRQLHDQMPGTRRLVGYDVAETPIAMAAERATDRLTFKLMDAAADDEHFDLMLIIDVIEHVNDPIAFLEGLRFKAKRTVLHIPLELSVRSMLNPNLLIWPRELVGHIHFFTPETAAATVRDAGYEIVRTTFTRCFDAPSGPRTGRGRALGALQRHLPRGVTVRLLGGYSLLVETLNEPPDGTGAVRPATGA